MVASATKREAALLLDRRQLAAKIRGARAILGWSQTELADKAGLSKRAVYQIEIAAVDVRRSTLLGIEQALNAGGVAFDEDAAAGFRLIVAPKAYR